MQIVLVLVVLANVRRLDPEMIIYVRLGPVFALTALERLVNFDRVVLLMPSHAEVRIRLVSEYHRLVAAPTLRFLLGVHEGIVKVFISDLSDALPTVLIRQAHAGPPKLLD